MKSPAETLTVALLQSTLVWEDKAANLSTFEGILRGLPGAEVAILPEMFSTGFTMNPAPLAEPMDGHTVSWMKRMASQCTLVLVGSVIISEGGHYFNRLLWVLPNGEVGYYDKRHLFAYAGEHEKYSPGNRRLIASVKGWRMNLQVCYDLRFPVWARHSNPVSTEGRQQMFSPEYDVLVYAANWPEKRRNAWRTLLLARAIENQSYVVGVNRVGEDGNGIGYVGDSLVADPLGSVVADAGNVAAPIIATLERKQLMEVRERLPFLRDSDRFIIGG